MSGRSIVAEKWFDDVMLRRNILRLCFGAGWTSALSGCGFRPLYGPSPTGQPGVAQGDLAAVQVAIIPDRIGQLLRQALVARFERGGVGISHRYELLVAYNISNEGISIQPDASVTRNRLIGNASWTLLAQNAARSTLTSGLAHSVDGIDIINEQFFAADLNREAAQLRICESVADQITLQLAIYFVRKNSG